MDVLHVSLSEIDDLTPSEFVSAFDYSWKTYTVRRFDYPLSKMLGDGKNPSKKKEIWKWSTPVSEELARNPSPPQKFLNAVRDNEI